MEELLAHLRDQSMTLTVYNPTESEARLDEVGARFAGEGIALKTDETEAGYPQDVGVFHQDERVVDAVSFDDLTVDAEFEALLSGESVERPTIPVEGTDNVTVSPETSRKRMLALSRRFERRALSHGEGTLHAGFQNLSVFADAEHTQSIYERLAATEVSVTVYGYPDATPGDVPYTVVTDDESIFRQFWFLLYDGGGDDEHKAALVSREQEPSLYGSFWTVDPDTVDELFELAREHYPLFE